MSITELIQREKQKQKGIKREISSIKNDINTIKNSWRYRINAWYSKWINNQNNVITLCLTLMDVIQNGYFYYGNKISFKQYIGLTCKSISSHIIGSYITQYLTHQYIIYQQKNRRKVKQNDIIIGNILINTGFNVVYTKAWYLIFPRLFDKNGINDDMEKALNYFHFTRNDVDNLEIFNEAEINKRYNNYVHELNINISFLDIHYKTLIAFVRSRI